MWWLLGTVFAFVTISAVIIAVNDEVAAFKARRRRKKLHHDPMIGCWGRSWK